MSTPEPTSTPTPTPTPAPLTIEEQHAAALADPAYQAAAAAWAEGRAALLAAVHAEEVGSDAFWAAMQALEQYPIGNDHPCNGLPLGCLR